MALRGPRLNVVIPASKIRAVRVSDNAFSSRRLLSFDTERVDPGAAGDAAHDPARAVLVHPLTSGRRKILVMTHVESVVGDCQLKPSSDDAAGSLLTG